MLVKSFNYNLPKSLIAQKPAKPRDHSRLLVYHQKSKKIEHRKFFEIINYLKESDVLVFNNTKVFLARLIGKRVGTGGKIEIFLLKKLKGNNWQVLVGGQRRREGLKIIFSKDLNCQIIKKLPDNTWQVKFNQSGEVFKKCVQKIGFVPTPPYIKVRAKLTDYQTVYAQKIGSVAAPTAGLHFTKRLLKQLKAKKVQFEYLTLHIGYGTFEPIKVKEVEKHILHQEFAYLDTATARRLNQAKKEGRRIIAVGTTTVRTLETFNQNGKVYSAHKEIGTFIYPGFKFKVVNALITNFHLPQSSLLILISALIGRKKTLEIYRQAVKRRYRFYSFGDVMLVD